MPTDALLSRAFGITSEAGASLPTRQKMILLAIDEIINRGPADFNANVVCDKLEIKHPMVNYHFGNRDGLLAEATVYVHDAWTQNLFEKVISAPQSPKKRLRAYVESEVEWAKRMGGMSVLIHYPISSRGSQEIVAEKYADHMKRNFEFNLATLTHLIIDIRNGKSTPIDFDLSNYPRVELVLRHPKAFLAATQIAWATHGLASWSSGDHIATRGLEEPTKLPSFTTKFAVDEYIKTIIKIAEGI